MQSSQKENPDQVELDGVQDGIEALPKRVERYGKAKKGALDTAKYMAESTKHQAMAAKVQGCGDYLLFRHFFTVDKVKLHAAQFCKAHLLCPLCAIRRGAKALAAYLERWEAIRLQRPTLRPFLVTLTVKDGPDLQSVSPICTRPSGSSGSASTAFTKALWMVSRVPCGLTKSSEAMAPASGIRICT